MARLILQRIEVEGFTSYKSAQAVHFGGQGAVAIVGKNGSGKSSLTSKALTWCLYGRCSPERMGNSTRALKGKPLISDGSPSARVSVILEAPTADPAWSMIVIERTKEVGGRETVTMTRGGGETTPSQAEIDALIGATYEVFTRTVVRGQNDPWSFAEATDSRKREILDAISGSDQLSFPYERAKAIRKHADQTIERCDREIAAAEILVQRNSIKCVSAEADLEHWNLEHKSRVDQVSREIKALRSQEKKVKAEEDEEARKAKELAKELANKPTYDVDPYQSSLSEATISLAEITTKISAIQREKATFTELSPGDPCPVCEQQVHDNSPALLRYQELDAEEADWMDQSDDIREHVGKCKTALEQYRDWYAGEQSAWDAKVADLQPRAMVGGDMLRESIRQATKRIEAIKAESNPNERLVVRLREDWSEAIRIQKRAAESRLYATQHSQHAECWERTLSKTGVRAQIAESTLAAIEVEANRWLSALSDGMSIAFPPTREVKGRVKEEIKTIVQAHGIERDLLTFSGGERRRVNLAVDLAVSRVSSIGSGLHLSLLVLDEEVFSGLDEEGKASVATALVGAGVEDVVVIDHDPRLLYTLSRTVEVEKGPSGSVVREITA